MKTLQDAHRCWVRGVNTVIEDRNIVGYKANVAITFVLEETT